ncbi:MAG: pyruvate kinase [Ignavibacteria bacterium]|nr:pyruvate kinase [Ignavibacteria bacterium]
MHNSRKLRSIKKRISELISDCYRFEQKLSGMIEYTCSQHRISAANLVHYMSVRRVDIRKLQNDLSNLAISSQAHSEGYILNNLQKTDYLLSLLLGGNHLSGRFSSLDLEQSKKLLDLNSAMLFGKAAMKGETKIMVTMPSEASSDYRLVYEMARSGMHIARINTAHDSIDEWKRMLLNIKRASASTGKKIRIYMDLAGPKIRTTLRNGGDKGIAVRTGDKLIICGTEAESQKSKKQNVIGISMPEILKFVRRGERVIFDDGKFYCRVLQSSPQRVSLSVEYVAKGKSLLKSEKGVNMPDTDLSIPSLTTDDIDTLPFAAANSDMLGYSFVRKQEDVEELYERLSGLGRTGIGIVLKIETKEAFDNLPSLVLSAMRFRRVGLMIARGDLAIEMGFRRMAEVQEEIMWLADAAHLPVIWATQVFENLVNKGIPSRAEISDAVKSVRAECAMLNKGPHITDAIRFLKDIDRRMSAHEEKKTKHLRSLSIAKDFLPDQ